MLNPQEENLAWWLDRKLRAVAGAYRRMEGHPLRAIVLSPRCWELWRGLHHRYIQSLWHNDPPELDGVPLVMGRELRFIE